MLYETQILTKGLQSSSEKSGDDTVGEIEDSDAREYMAELTKAREGDDEVVDSAPFQTEGVVKDDVPSGEKVQFDAQVEALVEAGTPPGVAKKIVTSSKAVEEDNALRKKSSKEIKDQAKEAMATVARQTDPNLLHQKEVEAQNEFARNYFGVNI